MKYDVISIGEAKPLADFYYGECFEAINLDAMGIDKDDPDLLEKVSVEDRSLMMVVGIEKSMFSDEPPQNVVFAVDFETAELCAYTDDAIAVPVVAQITTDDIAEV